VIEVGVVDDAEKGRRIDRTHADRPVVGLVGDDVAREERLQLRLLAEGLVCEGGVTRAEDPVPLKRLVRVQLFRERRPDVDVTYGLL
jgi:hypothetical protein